MTEPIYTSVPSQIASTSSSIAWSKNLSIKTGASFETEIASAIYSLSSASLYTIFIPRPPRTKDGRTNTGYPSFCAIGAASSFFLAKPFSGCLSPFLITKFENCSLSSAKSITADGVPEILAPIFVSASASFSGVCPPK